MAEKREYGPSCQGALFPNNFKKDGTQQPDWTGTVDVSKELLSALVDIAKELKEKANQGEEIDDTKFIKLRVAGWDRTAKNTGADYKYLTIEPLREKPEEPEETEEEDDSDDPPF
jgi:hypothetical protein